MVYRIKQDDVYIQIYKTLCALLQADEGISALLDGVVLDFDMMDTPPRTPPQLRNVPRVYIIPGSVQYQCESTNTNNLTIGYSFVLENFHIRDPKFHRLSFRLAQFLHNIPFHSIVLDNVCFPVICVMGGGNWEYSEDRETATHSITLQVNARV